MAQQRPGVDARPAFRVDVGVIDQVAGHQVDGALDALEVAAGRAREGAQHRGLADADVAFEQHVAAGEQRHVDEPDRLALADHRLGDFVLDAQRERAPFCQLFIDTHAASSASKTERELATSGDA